MVKLFKIRFLPNIDGTDSTTLITNLNTVFVHTYVGDDFSGDGTREYPYKSVFKASQKSGMVYIVFRGIVNESFNINTIIGDDINQIITVSNYSSGIYNRIRTTILSDKFYSFSQNASGCILNNILPNASSGYNFLIEYCLINSSDQYGYGYGTPYILNHCTTNGVGGAKLINNSIVIKYLDNNVDCVIKNTIIMSSTILRYNGIVLDSPIYTSDSLSNVQLLKNAFISAGMTLKDVNAWIHIDSFNNETCRVVLEDKNGGTSGNIFNRYNIDGSVLDYTLNPVSNNDALYTSDLGGYVGCFGPANAILPTDLDVPINVNSDGSDDLVNPATLLRGNIDNTFDFDTSSNQIWNRMRSHTTIIIPNGVKFRGSQSMEDDGSAFGYYFGKKQNLIFNSAITYSETLEPNTLYKVTNTNKDIFSAILYNGTQYLPDYFFKTNIDILSFSLLNDGSGTVVHKVLSIPFESEEIIPYDNINTPSETFPKFSCPFFSDVQMLFHKIGDRIDLPVLFSEFDNDKISYYSDYAVTSADQEFITLSSDSVNYYYKIPVIKYLRIELNAHFDIDYA